MPLLRALHRGLTATGELIGRLSALLLVLLLFVAPVLAMLMASLYAALAVTNLIGAASFFGYVLFLFFIGFIAWYVGPFIQPQISKAMRALLEEPKGR